MMATTHALAGAAVATLAAVAAPDLAPTAVAAALVGGLFPDADLYAGHRRTLHFPVYYAVLAVPALALAAAVPTTATVAAAAFLGSAALHSAMDAFGGGLELRPWRGESDRAVYDHWRGRWVAPRRWIRYDGAPEDLALAAVLAVPPLVAFGGHLRTVVAAVLGVSVVYAVVRKRLVDVAELVVERVPDSVLAYVPERFVRDLA